MLFDDRLSTVLRSGARGETALRTQYRQLLDLLGSMPDDAEASETVEAALMRLQDIVVELPAQVQSTIIRTPGLRIRNRSLVYCLAHAEPQVAAATMATARLDEADWLFLIPRLPIVARGFLRHRRDLPMSAKRLLERLGVGDLVLPEPPFVASPEAPQPVESAAPVAAAPTSEQPIPAAPDENREAWIGNLVRRIEEFQKSRAAAAEAAADPRLPLEEESVPEAEPISLSVDFETDSRGTITWADQQHAPMLVGLSLTATGSAALARTGNTVSRSIERRQPLSGANLVLDMAPPVAGAWKVDAEPFFDELTGSFRGYRGRMRRPVEFSAPQEDTGPADQLRQILHELRTPVNAIQGFAEIIQQQLFGPAPNEYRALAAAVSVDAAKLLAGFDEVDRLARLESRALELNGGSSDFREVVATTLQRLEGVLRPRGAKMELAVTGSPFTLGIGEGESLRMAWRLLAMLAGALDAAEAVDLTLASDEKTITLQAELPAALKQLDDLASAGTSDQPRAVSASMFGTGFAFRLARAETVSAGGSLERDGDTIVMRLPVLTESPADHSVDGQGSGSEAAM